MGKAGKTTDPKAAFGHAIRAARHERGLSQENLADEAALHRTYVGSIERGERNVSIDNMLKLARALQRPLSRLVQEMERELENAR